MISHLIVHVSLTYAVFSNSRRKKGEMVLYISDISFILNHLSALSANKFGYLAEVMESFSSRDMEICFQTLWLEMITIKKSVMVVLVKCSNFHASAFDTLKLSRRWLNNADILSKAIKLIFKRTTKCRCIRWGLRGAR